MRRNQRGIAQFASLCNRNVHEHGSPDDGEAGTMSAQLRPIGTIAFASAFLTSVLGVSVPANIAFAVDCLTAPNSAAPPNSHWYYRTDRTQERKCWHLRTDNGPSEQGAVQTV